jgi:hypothetical protein
MLPWKATCAAKAQGAKPTNAMHAATKSNFFIVSSYQ